jgi:hypothetical protein
MFLQHPQNTPYHNSKSNAQQDLEDKILRLLRECEGNILDDEQLIATLNNSKLTSAAIQVGGQGRTAQNSVRCMLFWRLRSRSS